MKKILIPGSRKGYGSTQHFAHFFYEYFLPLVSWRIHNNTMPVTVKDCGPCNAWFQLLAEDGAQIQIVKKQVFLRRIQEKPGISINLSSSYIPKLGWDPIQIYHFRLWAWSKATQRIEIKGIMIKRSKINPYYDSSQSEIKGSGSKRRSIANQQNISRIIQTFCGIKTVEFFDISPQKTINILKSSNILIAQRGAALMNLFILPPGALVIEILPKSFSERANVDIYKDAAFAAQLSYARIWQKNNFCGVQPLNILLAIFNYKTKRFMKTFLMKLINRSRLFQKAFAK